MEKLILDPFQSFLTEIRIRNGISRQNRKDQKTDIQKGRENQDLRGLIEEDKAHIINFLKALNLESEGNQITILFSENLERPRYKQPNEIVEPSIVKEELTLSNIKYKSPKEIREILDLNINKIQRKDFLDTKPYSFIT